MTKLATEAVGGKKNDDLDSLEVFEKSLEELKKTHNLVCLVDFTAEGKKRLSEDLLV